MTFSLDLPEHLATPFEFRAVEPTPFGARLPASPDSNERDPRSHLVRARTAVELHPDVAIAWARLAQAAQSAAESAEAIDTARKALAMGLAQRSRPAVHAAVAILNAYDRVGTIRDALRAHDTTALPADLRVWIAAEIGDDDEARDALETASSPRALAIRGWLELKQDRFQAAIAAYRRAQHAGADGPALLTNLGYAHAALGHLAKAIRLTKRAANLAPADRLIGFNLIGYYRAIGDVQRALSEIDRLKSSEALDIELALVLADLLHNTGASGKAHDVLQRIRTSTAWTTTDRRRRSELEANLAFLRWATRRQDRDTTIRAVTRALRDCDHGSLAIAFLLLNLCQRPQDADTIEETLKRLEPLHPEPALLGLQMHLAVLRRLPDDAVRFACAWARQDIFNPSAAAVAIHLLTDLQGRAAEAADLGLAALNRTPGSTILVNNTAYALALAGRPEDAKRLLGTPTADGEEVALTATRALAEMLLGHVERGLDGYERARMLARTQNNEQLEALVLINQSLAIHRLSPEQRALANADHPPQIPDRWRESPSFWIVQHRIRRELPAAAA